jgi:hypothetical protein
MRDPTEFITVDGQPIPIGKNLAKHFQGTENDHDQSAHAGGRGKGDGVVRYSPPEHDYSEEGLRVFWDYERKFLDSVFDNNPMASNDEQYNEWHRARDVYVAQQEGGEDVAVRVNRGLREGSGSASRSSRIRMFDEMTGASTVTQDVEVWRSAVLSPEQVERLQNGVEFVDPGFQSSDFKRDTAEYYGFSRWAHGGPGKRGQRDGVPVLFRIRLKAGTNAAYVGYNEVVIQRDTRVRVTSDPKDMGPFMSNGSPRREFDVYGVSDSGYVTAPNAVIVDVEVSK